MPQIETERLHLRMPTPQDVDDIAALFADPDVMRFIGLEAGAILSRAETESTVEKMIAFWTRTGFGRWAVIDKETRKLIGLCGLRLLDGTPELFYLFAKATWGKGLATEAASAALRYGFEELQFERIIAVIRPGNTISQKVVKKIGMKYEKELNHDGVDGVCYVATLKEFEPSDSTYIRSRDAASRSEFNWPRLRSEMRSSSMADGKEPVMPADEDAKAAEGEMSETEIDQNLLDTFPASDPPSWTLGTNHTADSQNQSPNNLSGESEDSEAE